MFVYGKEGTAPQEKHGVFVRGNWQGCSLPLLKITMILSLPGSRGPVKTRNRGQNGRPHDDRKPDHAVQAERKRAGRCCTRMKGDGS